MITSKLLNGVRHGFLTRRGGVSGGLYASLNCGFGSDDDAANVAANRSRALERLGLAGGPLVTAYQVHSPDVAVVTEPWRPGDAPQVDGLVTNRPGVALGVLTADCAPVLFADAHAGVIGAAHAGWKGALDGVAEATFRAMEELGASAAHTRAVVGPAIGRESYEVGPEFHQTFVDHDRDNAAFFDASSRRGHFMFDLTGYVLGRLAVLGLQSESVGCDTLADGGRFFSYRRTTLAGEADYGRGLSAIVL